MKVLLPLLAAASAIAAARAVNLRRSALSAHEAQAETARKAVQSFEATNWLEAPAALMARAADAKMSFQEALDRLSDKMPKDVAVLVKAAHTSSVRGVSSGQGPFAEDSLQKARKILNGMIEASQAEMDDVIIDCEEFKASNRRTFEQVVTDLARLGSEIAEAEEEVAENMACVATQDGEFKSISELLRKQERQYAKTRAADERELVTKRNDLAVFNFIMDLTKCQDGAALVQVSSASNESVPMSICTTDAGFELNFRNPKIQADFDAIMTPSARLAIRDALGLAFGGKLGMSSRSQDDEADERLALLQDEEWHHQKPTTVANTTTKASLLVTPKPSPVKKEPNKESQWKKCTDGKPDCGLLHDTMSLQWGKFKDLVDQLQDDMNHNADEWERLKGNLNGQLKVITHQKSECQTKFDQTVSEKNMLSNERNDKDQQHFDLSAVYETKMAACKARIEEILFTDICAVRTVRNTLMVTSTVSPPLKISDCEVGQWVAKPCSVPCDDTCPHMVGKEEDPYSCGGWMDLQRQVIVRANEFGIKCPATSRRSRCGQFKCAVDCEMSEWSGWSKCTKECEGGAQQMTRSIITKPKHGGQECSATVDTRACNTGSCDRDCTLSGWGAWSPCSMACNPGKNPGYQERQRGVLVPIRGQGKCPKPEAAIRYQSETCNEQPCQGDEICIARMDLIIALDASGSLGAEGYQVVRDFAATLITRFQSKYLGMDKVRIGAILFGNGKREDDGTISAAIPISGLTDDYVSLTQGLQGTSWQRGFTNMAQAFLLAEDMLQQGGRSSAQSAVLVLSDGKYSFAFETEKAVQELKAKNTAVLMVPIAARPGKFEKQLKLWATQPWETNYQLIPGISALSNNMVTYSSTLISKFCSHALSPSINMMQESEWGMMLVREGGRPDKACSPKPIDLGYVRSRMGCKRKAEQEALVSSFSIGYEPGRELRRCWGEGFAFAPAEWSMYMGDKTDIPCPKGNWTVNPAYDTYAIQPL